MSVQTMAVDLGQGSCRVVTVIDGRMGARQEFPGFRADRDPVEPVLDAILRAAARYPGVEWRLGIGMTGLNGVAPDADSFVRRLASHGVRGEVAICDDSVTAYLGALGERSGAIISAGTGAVALAANLPDRVARSDGWGAALGDRGSGYWIGMRAVRAALRSLDQRRPNPLLDLVIERWGEASTLPERWRTQRPSPEQVAAIAPRTAVIARAGDPIARQIWNRAGQLLGESVVDVLRAVDLGGQNVPVAGVGGLFGATDLLTDGFSEALRLGCPSAEIVPSAGDPLDGALVLASPSSPASALEALVTRHSIIGESNK